MFLQMWDMRTQKLREDLPGHADEVNSQKIEEILVTIILITMPCINIINLQ